MAKNILLFEKKYITLQIKYTAKVRNYLNLAQKNFFH